MKLIEKAVELHEELNPKLWEDDKLIQPVREALLQVVHKYVESSDALNIEDIIDAELLGSNASYNYTEYSDLDLHLVVNMEAISCDKDLFQLACNAERSNFNKNYDISVKGIPVELYVEDVKAGTASNGIYSLFKDEWIKFPEPINVPNYDNDNEYNELLNKWRNKGQEILSNATSSHEVQDYINNLYNLRRNSIMSEGEFGKGNLVFKEIRNDELLDNLKKKQYELSSKELSLESLEESTKISVYRGIDKSLEQLDKGVSWWTTSEEDAYAYGPGGADNPEDGEVLSAKLDLGAYKILSVNVSPKGILDVYICPEVLRAANLMLIHKTATEIVALDKQNKRQYKIKNSLGVIQPFINQRLKDNGFKALNATFKMGSRDVNEIAVFDDHILADISAYDTSGKHYSL